MQPRSLDRVAFARIVEQQSPPGARRTTRVGGHRPGLAGPVCHGPKRPRFTGVCLPLTSATGADVTADAACPGAPVIVDRYLAHNEVAVHVNPDAGPAARIAAFAGVRPVLGSDRLTVGPAWLQRMALAELGRFSVASMVSRPTHRHSYRRTYSLAACRAVGLSVVASGAGTDDCGRGANPRWRPRPRPT
jgi:hypothetical protein